MGMCRMPRQARNTSQARTPMRWYVVRLLTYEVLLSRDGETRAGSPPRNLEGAGYSHARRPTSRPPLVSSALAQPVQGTGESV